MQTALEAREYPLLHHVLPMYMSVREQLVSLASGVLSGTVQSSESAYDKNLAQTALNEFDKI